MYGNVLTSFLKSSLNPDTGKGILECKVTKTANDNYETRPQKAEIHLQKKGEMFIKIDEPLFIV